MVYFEKLNEKIFEISQEKEEVEIPKKEEIMPLNFLIRSNKAL